MSHVVTIVQARMGSARLPGKALRPLAGQPLILHVMARAAAMGHPAWLATTLLERDDLLFETAVRAGYPAFRGDERDVLGRMCEAAEAACADVVVRVTGDCPCLAPDVGERVVALYRAHGGGCIATNDTSTSGWPDGLDVEVFSMDTLRQANRVAARPEAEIFADRRERDRLWRDREHVTLLMRRTLPHHVLPAAEDWRRVKLSVDEPADFARVARVMGLLNGGGLGWPALREALVAWEAEQEEA